MFERIDSDQSFLKEKAFKYRISLIDKSFTNEEEKELIKSFFSRMNFNLSSSFFMSGLNPISITRSQKIGRDFKNAMTYLYFYNKSKESEFFAVDSFIKDTKNFLLAGYEEVNKLKSNLSSSFLEHKKNASRIIKKSYFENNANLRRRESGDPRMGIGFSSYQNLSFGKSCLKLPEYSRKQIKAKEIYLLEEKSFLGNAGGPIYWGNVKNIQKENDTFDFLVFQRLSFPNARIIRPRNVSITLLFDFIGNEKINELNIKSASINEIEIDSILYNGDTEINFKSKKGSEGITVYFEPIKAKKIEIKISQPTYIDLQTIRNESKENAALRNNLLRYVEEESFKESGLLYDLSIKQISFYYTNYRKKGIYVDSEEVEVSSPLSAKLEVSYLKDRETVFVEKYLQITLLGENDLTASGGRFENLRFDKKVSVPSGEEKEKELLVVKNKEAALRFKPDADTLQVYKNGDLLHSISGYSLNEEVIRFSQATSIKKTDILYAVYKIQNDYFVENNFIKIKDGKLLFQDQLNSCSGTFLPIIIMRSGIKENDDTDIVQDITLTIEEKENNDNVSIRRNIIEETPSRSNSNVS